MGIYVEATATIPTVIAEGNGSGEGRKPWEYLINNADSGTVLTAAELRGRLPQAIALVDAFDTSDMQGDVQKELRRWKTNLTGFVEIVARHEREFGVGTVKLNVTR